MKKQSSKKTTSNLSTPSTQGKSQNKGSQASKSVLPEVLAGTTGIAVLSAAAIGVAGFFAWKNREKILGFIGNYVDLPEGWTADSSEDSSADVGTLASHTSTYTAPTTEQRM